MGASRQRGTICTLSQKEVTAAKEVRPCRKEGRVFEVAGCMCDPIA
jgi:hypothetical protein